MRALLYGLGSAVMLGASVSLALMPRVAPWPWVFLVAGGILSSLIGGSWLLTGATAGQWPRPRAGLALMAAGLVGAALGLAEARWLDLIWAALILLGGAGLTFRIFPNGAGPNDRRSVPGTVRPPISRREGM